MCWHISSSHQSALVQPHRAASTAVDLCFCCNRNLNCNKKMNKFSVLFISFTVEKEILYTQKHRGENQCTVLILEVVCQFVFTKIPPPGQSGLKLFHRNKSMCSATTQLVSLRTKRPKGHNEVINRPAGWESNRCFLKNRQTYRQMG